MQDDANTYIVEQLQSISAYQVLIWIVLAVVVIGLAYRAWQLLERYRKAINEIEKKNNLIEEHDETIEDLQVVDKQIQDEINKVHEQHISDMQDLQKVDQKLRSEFERVYEKIDNISDKITDMQERNDSRERADIKSHISSLYQKFHEQQCWNYMEKEAMEDLIASYEDCGGKNSFVHDVVQKEMYTLDGC